MATEIRLQDATSEEQPLFVLPADIDKEGLFIENELHVFPDALRVVAQNTTVRSIPLASAVRPTCWPATARWSVR